MLRHAEGVAALFLCAATSLACLNKASLKFHRLTLDFYCDPRQAPLLHAVPPVFATLFPVGKASTRFSSALLIIL